MFLESGSGLNYGQEALVFQVVMNAPLGAAAVSNRLDGGDDDIITPTKFVVL